MMRSAGIVVLLMSLGGPLAAQRSPQRSLRSLIAEFFIFGPGGDPLFLAGTADPGNPIGVQTHADHFAPGATSTTGDVIAFLESFLTSAIGSNIANIPIAATSSGRAFRLEGGAPVRAISTPGPIFAEGAHTLGLGHFLLGASVNVFNFKTFRGVDLSQFGLNLVHENADFPGCDTIFGGDCTLMGIPGLENDVIHFDGELAINVTAFSFLMSYGLHDRVDIGVAIPFVVASLSGHSDVQVVPFGGPTATHFFAGTPDNPDLFASRSVEGSESGIGDIALRVKGVVSRADPVRFALLADARLATGSEEDLLGSGAVALRALAILSAQFETFGSHLNVGYVYRKGALQNDAVLATAGFTQLVAPWATLVVDLVTELQVGESKFPVPEPVTIDAPFRRTILPTPFPEMRDDIVNLSLGLKAFTSTGITIIANSMLPMSKGGLRPRVAWMLGLEYNF